MISVEEALDRILSHINVLESEEKYILNSLGQVIAEDVFAPFNVPMYDNSAMDGYALRYADIKGANKNRPKILKVKGEVPAGKILNVTIGEGECVKIMTGGIIPEGADVVVPLELTDIEDRKKNNRKETEIGINCELQLGANIRKAGEDMQEGELIIECGKLIRPAEIGIMASIGKDKVTVIRRPKVCILSTGNELVDLRGVIVPGKIFNSNSYSLAAQVTQYGGNPQLLGIARDNIDDLTKAFKRFGNCDLLVTSGGVSVGEYDFVKKVLISKGEMDFWQVRIKPGKPITFGVVEKNNKKIPYLGLPGNPVSCMIGLEIFGKPAIYKMMGRKDYTTPKLKAILEDKIINTDNRRIYARVIVEKRDGEYYARLTGNQGSAVLTSMVKANGLAIIPESKNIVDKGEHVDIILF